MTQEMQQQRSSLAGGQMHKTEVHGAVHGAIVRSLDVHESDGAVVLVIIKEVSEGDWGAAGPLT